MICSNSSEHGLRARSLKSTSVSCLRHQIKLLNMNIIFLSIILHYSKHFQFNPKNSINKIKWLNIAKITRNIPDFNKKYNTLYMHSRKNWEWCVNFFLHNFAVCHYFAVCNIAGTQQTRILCRVLDLCRVFLAWHTAEKKIVVCQTFVVCCFCWHTAKGRFAVCPSLRTRQSLGHTATLPFPVVIQRGH